MKTIRIKATTMKSLKNVRTSIFLGLLAFGTIELMAPSLTLAEGKGASKLMFVAASSQSGSPTVSAHPAQMSCGKCVDVYTKSVDSSAKGMSAGSLRTVATHMCTSCQTTISSVGAGKAKQDKVVHTCGNDRMALANCCMAAR
jgi:hypothetical protein